MKKILLSAMLLLCTIAASAQSASFEKTLPLRVEGNHLVDTSGKQVMLHGIMDTPSPYFCGYRFTDGKYIDVYRQGDEYITKCILYFRDLFAAVTDASQDQHCNVFRLHLDPCWTNDGSIPSTGSETGEANISQYSRARLEKYLNKLYIPIARNAQNLGMYVIMRPPGVCPHTIKVGDAYQKYLLDVWDAVTKNANVLNASGWLSLELANEPVTVLDANGNQSDKALHDFFQPILEKVRANGFKGIVWIPGATWQQNYKSYAINPITDVLTDAKGNVLNEQSNIGYAVHFYPGWFSTSDNIHDANTSIRSFLDMVPVVKDYPIMITEVDWSPENPNGQGHYNESGQWVIPNYGTWATGSTSKFGLAYKAVLDYFGNIGMTLTHTHDYLDIDHFRSTTQYSGNAITRNGEVRPAFYSAMNGNAYEACSGACFQWYAEYAAKEIKAREWGAGADGAELFPLRTTSTDPADRVMNTDIWEKGSFNPSTGQLITGQYGFAGWVYDIPVNLSQYQYIVIQLRQPAANNVTYSASFRLFDQSNYFGKCYPTSLAGKSTIVVPLIGQKKEDGTRFNVANVCMAGFWTLGGANNAIYIDRIFLSNDGVSPVTDVDLTASHPTPVTVIERRTLSGSPANEFTHGIIIERLSNGQVRKVRR